MPRPSPASTRVVEVLDFLAANPGESFRLSELARRLDFNKATVHGMLAVLADANYLIYDPEEKTFRLGPAMLGLAQSAVQDNDRITLFAAPEMEALAAAVDGQVVANVVHGDELVVIASHGQPASGGRGTRLGYRGRLAPPLGMIFVAWASPARVDAWLDRVSADAKERARYRTLLAAVNERGFSISADAQIRARLDAVIAQLQDASKAAARDALHELMARISRGEHELLDIQPNQSYRARQISAPVFDAQGAVRMGLLITGLPELTGAELLERAHLLTAAAGRVSDLVGGRDPFAATLAAG